MRKKQVLVIVIMMLVCSGALMADTPSVFDVGVMNYYKIQDIADSEFTTYTPGVRMTFYICDWFGLAGDLLVEEPFSGNLTGYAVIASTDLVFRWPLGFFEPYAALGPTYRMTLNNSEFVLEKKVMYNLRLGFDFNITRIFGLGIEANHIVNIPNLLDDPATFDLMKNTYVGLVLKVKL